MTTAPRRTELDGLRSLAVIPVLIGHAWPGLLPGGHLGVDVFFVLSGYLIAGLIVSGCESGKFSLADFYARRLRRLMPAFFLVLFATVLASWAVHTPSETSLTLRTGLFAAFSASNVMLPTTGGYFSADAEMNPLLHTWSLGVEEQFYLVFPIIIIGVLRWAPRRLGVLLGILIIVSLAHAARLHAAGSPSAHYSTPGRAWELLLGALFATSLALPARTLRSRLPNAIVSAVAWISLATFTLAYAGAAKEHDLTAQAIVCLATLGVIWSCSGHLNAAACVLHRKPLVWIGLISYPLYLWHQPVMAFSRLFVPSETMTFLAGTMTLSVILAAMTHHMIERPARRLPITLVRGLIGTITGAATMFVIVASSAQSHWWEGRYSGAGVDLTQHPDEAAARRCALWGLLDTEDVTFCIFPAATRQAQDAPTVAIWGDSHAMALASGFVAIDRPYNVLHLGVSGCRIQFAGAGSDPTNNCARKHNAALDRILADPTVVTVVLHSRWRLPHAQSSPGMQLDLEYAMQKIQQAGRNIVVVAPVPTYTRSVPEMLLRRHRTGFDLVETMPLGQHLTDQTRMRDGVLAAAKRFGATILLPEEYLCPSDRCQTELDGRPLYYDNQHLSVYGAALLARPLDAVLRQSIPHI